MVHGGEAVVMRVRWRLALGPDKSGLRRVALLAGVTVGVLAADQAAKAVAVRLLSENHPQPLAAHYLYLTLKRNTGGAFGILPQAPEYLIAASAVIAVALLCYARTALTHSALLTLSLALVLGGALGNLIDRVRLGHVIDFIDLRVWPVFNIADIAVTLGVALIILAVLLPHKSRER